MMGERKAVRCAGLEIYLKPEHGHSTQAKAGRSETSDSVPVYRHLMQSGADRAQTSRHSTSCNLLEHTASYAGKRVRGINPNFAPGTASRPIEEP